MATQLQLRKGTTAQTAIFTGAIAEVTVDTTQKTVVVHDGTTVGGNYIITKGQLDSNVSILQGINTTQNTNITAVNGYAVSAYATANGANGMATGAYAKANNALANTTGTFAGDLTITGNTIVNTSLSINNPSMPGNSQYLIITGTAGNVIGVPSNPLVSPETILYARSTLEYAIFSSPI